MLCACAGGTRPHRTVRAESEGQQSKGMPVNSGMFTDMLIVCNMHNCLYNRIKSKTKYYLTYVYHVFKTFKTLHLAF